MIEPDNRVKIATVKLSRKNWPAAALIFVHSVKNNNRNKIIGVITGFYGKQKQQLDQTTGTDMLKILGLWSFFKKLPTLIKINQIIAKNIAEDGYYINSLCLERLYQGQGLGSQILEIIVKKYNKVYLDVNINNYKALNFYQKLGFQIQSENIIMLKKKKIGTYLLKKE